MDVSLAQQLPARNVLHIVPTYFPATYWGGPIYSSLGLCGALAASNKVQLKVLTTDSAGPHLSDRVRLVSNPARMQVGTEAGLSGYDVYYCRRVFGHSFSISMLAQMWGMVKWADVVHLTAVYSPPTIPALMMCLILGRPVVWSPRGALQRWQGTTRPVAKKIWERICSILIDRRRLILHATSESEATESLARIPGLVTLVVPNGVEIPPQPTQRSWRPEGRVRLLYIGRLHPKKGIENLLEAIKLAVDPRISLVICGSGDTDYLASLRDFVDRSDLAGIVEFRGHVNGAEKMRAFGEADICIVPSFTENFGMVVAESLAHGVPVIASHGTPWDAIVRKGCGLWVGNSPQSLRQAVFDMLAEDLAEMGKRGRAWMLEDYGWDAMADRMCAAYAELTARSKNDKYSIGSH